MTGIHQIALGLSEEFKRVLPGQRKTQRENLSLLIATMLDVRSANLMDLAAGLPREADRDDMRYQWISRVLSNRLIDVDQVMGAFAKEVLTREATAGQPLVLIMDQSKLSDRHQVLMLAMRFGERALPLAWRVEATQGGIGFEVQKQLLEVVADWLPESSKACLMGDRFYGTPDLIGWCKAKGWDYRLRLKSNLKVHGREADAKTGDLTAATKNARITGKKIQTHIGVICDPCHDEPWIIAMSEAPGYLKTLEYSKRWGIEAMFSDFKSRGFGVEDTHIYHTDRLSRLLMIMALALYAAVSTGLWDLKNNPFPAEKNSLNTSPRSFNVPNYPGSQGA